MTYEQLRIFVAVAERQHLTQAATALSLTPSAVSAAIKALENLHSVSLFDRVGRGIELSREGRIFLGEAKETLARFRQTQTLLSDLGKQAIGTLDIQASQTISNYWLPSMLLNFSEHHPRAHVNLKVGNTATVADAVVSGEAELGFVEGTLENPALTGKVIASDRLVVVSADSTSNVDAAADLYARQWILREVGSGTRSEFERALKDTGVDPRKLQVSLVLPSNEAVLTAVLNSRHLTVLSETIVAPFVATGQLHVLPFELPLRHFTILRHRERHRTSLAREFEAFCGLRGGNE